jgi:hypothetical protein
MNEYRMNKSVMVALGFNVLTKDATVLVTT